MGYSIFIDNEGNQRMVTDGVIEPPPGMGKPDSKLEDNAPITRAQGERIIALLERLVDGQNPPTD